MSWKQEGRGVLSYLFPEDGWALEAPHPASHSPSWLLRSIHRAVGEELGGLIWGGRVQAFCLLIHFEEHLLFSLLLVQIFFQSLGQREGRQSSVRSHRTGLPIIGPPPKWPSLETRPPSGPSVHSNLVFPLSFPRAGHPEDRYHLLLPSATSIQEFAVGQGL